MKENPIDICDMSDDECLKSEKQKSYDVYSVDGSDVLVDPDGFDADALFADSIDVFEPISREEAEIFNSPRVKENERIKVGLFFIQKVTHNDSLVTHAYDCSVQFLTFWE